MNVEGRERREGSVLDDSSLTIATASELTSPLILLRQFSLSLGDETISEEERKKISQQLMLTSERALRLASSLNMTRMDQYSLPIETLNPVSVCMDVIHELTPLFVAHGQSLELKQRARIPLLVGNRQLLQKILLGFADNALHYGQANRPIQMTISARGKTVRIGVRDYGPALPIDTWQRLEGRIARRAVAPLASRPQSSGIGLIAARRMAELMESTVGLIRHRDGATFYVDLHVSNQMSLL
jgi:K+-sensing histidine kinase KdpD